MTLSKAKMKAIVETQNEALGNCFTKGDVDKLAEMYTDSAKLSPNGSRFIIGRDSIKSFWKEDFKTSKVLKMETLVLTINGDENYIYETGKAFSEILYNDSVYHARVKYINVWRKQPNGEYKLDVDFWNKDMQ
jgi:ketosteroid isomerase-like protein